MPLMTRLMRFASSRQGRRLAAKASSYARSPEGKRKIEQVRRQIADRAGSRRH
jgi:hypothetical protein